MKNKKILYLILIVIGLCLGIGLTLIFVKDDKPKQAVEEIPKIEEKEEQTPSEEVIDKETYLKMESYINEQAILYAMDKFSVQQKIITKEVNLSTLLSEKRISKEKVSSLKTKETCEAYTIVTLTATEISGKTYLKCANYTTEGYNDNHLKIEDKTTNNNSSSKEESKIVIENYFGKDYQSIKQKLEKLGLKVIIYKKESTSINSDIIIEQSIKPGSKAKEGDVITLYIPDIATKYPNFAADNYSVNEVKKFAQKYNLILTINYEESKEYKSGIVYYQSKPAGSTIIEGQKLIIKVAK